MQQCRAAFSQEAKGALMYYVDSQREGLRGQNNDVKYQKRHTVEALATMFRVLFWMVSWLTVAFLCRNLPGKWIGGNKHFSIFPKSSPLKYKEYKKLRILSPKLPSFLIQIKRKCTFLGMGPIYLPFFTLVGSFVESSQSLFDSLFGTVQKHLQIVNLLFCVVRAGYQIVSRF